MNHGLWTVVHTVGLWTTDCGHTVSSCYLKANVVRPICGTHAELLYIRDIKGNIHIKEKQARLAHVENYNTKGIRTRLQLIKAKALFRFSKWEHPAALSCARAVSPVQ